MERSESVVKSQDFEFQADGSSEYIPDNPFLVKPVLVKLLKLVDSVSQLKELRKMCQTWDEFTLKEIEDRAFNGKLKAIDFQGRDKFTTEAEANLVQFLGDTKFISRLFSSFKFKFPESWTIFQNHMEFFSLYSVTFVHLGFPMHVEQIEVLLPKFLETEFVGNFKEMIVSALYFDMDDCYEQFDLPDISLFIQSAGNPNVACNLEKINIKFYGRRIFEIFESAFASGKYINLRSIRLAQIPSGNIDFPGLNPCKLTRLEVDKIGLENDTDPSDALKFTSDLIKMTANGMRLKNFSVKLIFRPIRWRDDYITKHAQLLPTICSNLTQFFSTQASTLNTLKFNFISNSEEFTTPEGAEIWAKIHLPQFEVLYSLRLNINFRLYESGNRKNHSILFGMTQNLNFHFPKLANLTLVRWSSLNALKVNPAPDEDGGLELKCLKLLYFDDNPADWNASFEGVIRSVEELHCPSMVLYEERLPWAESLRQLQISDKYIVRQSKFFKLKHLKKLERIFAPLGYFDFDDDSDSCRWWRFRMRRRFNEKVNCFLATFKEATQLSLTSITFWDPKMAELKEEVEEKFIKYFPYPVEFNVET